jgi:DNA-binding CsgD family transcriptional regulator
MTARANARGQPITASGKEERKRNCMDAFDAIPFQLGDRICWAVRPDMVNIAPGNSDGQFSAECDAHSLCGWLRVGNEAYLVLTQTGEVDDRGDQAPAKDEPWEVLSEREMQIAILVSLGKGTKQIAGHLLISEHTVQSYMRRIFSKLHVSTRPAMVAQLVSSWIVRANRAEAAIKGREGH